MCLLSFISFFHFKYSEIFFSHPFGHREYDTSAFNKHIVLPFIQYATNIDIFRVLISKISIT